MQPFQRMVICAALTVLAAVPLSAQSRISAWKACESSYGTCYRKCGVPIYVQIEDGPNGTQIAKQKPNGKYHNCVAKCSDSLNACVVTRTSDGPMCQVARDCPPQADGSPVLCVNGKCVVT
jgi:hypothetical protein